MAPPPGVLEFYYCVEPFPFHHRRVIFLHHFNPFIQIAESRYDAGLIAALLNEGANALHIDIGFVERLQSVIELAQPLRHFYDNNA